MGARSVKVLIAVWAVFGLSGCYGDNFYSTTDNQQPGQEILDGTLRNPEDWSDQPRPGVGRVAKVRAREADRMAVGSIVTPPRMRSEDWVAWERRENERLRRSSQICRGC